MPCDNGCVSTSSLADLAVTNAKLATATSGNTPNWIVLRDNNGGFAAGALTLSGKVDQNSNDGFVAKGTFDSGTIPATGPGTRLMWYPGKAAFRAGSIGTFGNQWDDLRVGDYSVAMNFETTASGSYSTALGYRTTASGENSTAMGRGTTASQSSSTALGNMSIASGQVSTAIGNQAEATGIYSTAIGIATIASGSASIAMGSYASTNQKSGAFVYGDQTGSFGTKVTASANNQFVVRAQHFWLGTHNTASNPAGEFITTSTGAHLTTGGVWTNSSDVNRKHRFQPVDADATLERLAALPITTWTYRGEADSVRHLGPTAQDFYAAFGLGQTDTGIGTVDADGVSLLAAQALERRTRALAQENAVLRAQVADLERRLARLEAAPKP